VFKFSIIRKKITKIVVILVKMISCCVINLSSIFCVLDKKHLGSSKALVPLSKGVKRIIPEGKNKPVLCFSYLCLEIVNFHNMIFFTCMHTIVNNESL